MRLRNECGASRSCPISSSMVRVLFNEPLKKGKGEKGKGSGQRLKISCDGWKKALAGCPFPGAEVFIQVGTRTLGVLTACNNILNPDNYQIVHEAKTSFLVHFYHFWPCHDEKAPHSTENLQEKWTKNPWPKQVDIRKIYF